MSENETASARERRGREQSATSSNVRGNDTEERAFMHRWRSAVFNSRKLPQGVRMTLLALGEFADENGNDCFPAAATLARLCGSSDKTVRTNLAIAEREGWFKRAQMTKGAGSGKEWASYRYSLTIPADVDTRRPPAFVRAEKMTAATDGAEETTAPSDPCSGNSGSMVRKFPADGAVTVTDELASNSLLNSPRRDTRESVVQEKGDESQELPDDHRVYDVAHARGVTRAQVKLAFLIYLDERREPCGVDCLDIFRREVGRNWANLWTPGNCSHPATLTDFGIHKAHMYGMADLFPEARRAS